MRRLNMLGSMLLLLFLLLLWPPLSLQARAAEFKLGSEVLLEQHLHLLERQRIGLVTNQSGVNQKKESTVDLFAREERIQLTALFAPEHGLDGRARAGEYVESFIHGELGIPVYSLYGATRKPSPSMLQQVDVLVVDLQDIGARSYTYMSTLNYCLVAAREQNKTVVVLDRPNPLGGMVVEGPLLEDRFNSFVGVDNLPKAHGMTAGELAQFFNRKIGARLQVVPMEGYRRNYLFQDTGLDWVQTSPNIPDLASVLGYLATGLGEGTGVFQADQFKWIGGKGLSAEAFAGMLNGYELGGVRFIPETRGEAGGVRLDITDPYRFNPARTGIYALTTAFALGEFQVPTSGATPQSIVMFDKIMGTDRFGRYLKEGLTPPEIESRFAADLDRFKAVRKQYLISQYDPEIIVVVSGGMVEFDTQPYIDENYRTMVPLRFVAEGLEARVDWDSEKRAVTVSRNGKKLIFTIDSTQVHDGDQSRTMDTVPVIRQGRTLIPLRYVSEYLGARVDWNGTWLRATID